MQEWEQQVDEGIGMTWGFLWRKKWLIAALFLLFFVALPATCLVTSWFGEAAQVAREEFGPRELLKKYEWFKDCAAQLDAKQADIKVFFARIKALEECYEDERRKDWAREDRQQHAVWQSEVAGVKASYNGLAAEYNAQMAKFNWRFCNAGTLPEGADVPLPREYRAYRTE